MQYGMTVDTQRCIGCHTCAVACKVENNLSRNTWWNRVLTVGGEERDTPDGLFPNCSMSFATLACQHCENPACVKVCPVGATYKNEENGVVIQDYDKCIGCRYCMAACPYNGVRNFSWEEPSYVLDHQVGGEGVAPIKKNTVNKCTMCAHRLARGLEPACIANCPARAREFGDFDDPESKVSKLVRERSYTKLLDEYGTNPSIYFLT